MVGDAEKDKDALTAASPLAQAARITKPLFLAFGGSDERVPVEHGLRLREAMRKAGHDPQWVVYNDEAHGWYKLETRLDFASRMEKFLAQHLR
jgi:dipeptidyl aminopeptidase/acylaminoacyl peptidase